MTQTPAGWYPDPFSGHPGQPAPLRYWDGWRWTGHVYPHPMDPPPYTGPELSPVPTTPDGVRLSGWWRRVGAHAIDSLLISVFTSIVTIPLQLRAWEEMNGLIGRFRDGVDGSHAPPDVGTLFHEYFEILRPVLAWSGIAGFVAWAVYNLLMLRFEGATVGKMAAGICVRLRERPGQLPWSVIFVRVLVQHGVLLTAAVVPLLYLALSWFPYLDSLWPLWDKKRQALHDKAARTNVVLVR